LFIKTNHAAHIANHSLYAETLRRFAIWRRQSTAMLGALERFSIELMRTMNQTRIELPLPDDEDKGDRPSHGRSYASLDQIRKYTNKQSLAFPETSRRTKDERTSISISDVKQLRL
jgi:hypothetical protein